ncbi:LysE family translocator [Aestuariivirga sp.]|uniref:LysE family translocator n=1 Tax=Aestuariivirga sp. TaxID=2650926 RepID=UPI0039E22CD3
MLIEPAVLAIFLAASLTLNLTPGNDMMFVLGQSLRGGPPRGIAASLGIATGSLVHLGLVALGVAAVLARHPTLFDAIRYACAAYLLWMAWQNLRKAPLAPAQAVESGSAAEAWRQGVFVNLLNPKIIVFMFAFLPPFVHPENGSPLLQLLLLGMTFNIGGTLINIGVALLSGRILRTALNDVRGRKWLAAIVSSLYVFIAARIALARP